MFDNETSDMLPREAPKPTAVDTEDIGKPMVPEVSMVFGQQQNENQQQQQQQQPPKKVKSYAAWKKQMLPQVVYPPSERANFVNIEDLPLPLNNLYPFRPPLASLPQQLNNHNINNNVGPPLTTHFGTLSNQYNGHDNEFYRRSISSAPPMFSHPLTVRSNTAPMPIVTDLMGGNYNTAPATSYQQRNQIIQRRSLDAMSNMNNGDYRSPPTSRPSTAASHAVNDVLTICAGTQTDNQYFANDGAASIEKISPETLSQFATKSDIEKLFSLVQQIRADQMRLINVCDVILLDQQQQQQQPTQKEPTQKSDVATQYEIQETNVKQVRCQQVNGDVPNFQSPRPAAQSTAYHANTPTGILRQRAVPQPKATDKTITMNELALKYLPNAKLHELLHDMHITGPRNAITERVMMAAKSPNDISNASYKYLKKYRLLPDEHITASCNSALATPNNGRNFNMESPNQLHQEQRSPFEPRAADSPILISRRPSNEINSHEDVEDHDSLNLEELRNKPKFL